MSDDELTVLARASAEQLLSIAKTMYGDKWPQMRETAAQLMVATSGRSPLRTTAQDFFTACDLAASMTWKY